MQTECQAICLNKDNDPTLARRTLLLPPPLPLLHLILGRRRAAVSIDHHHCDELLSVAGAQGEVGRHVRCDAIQTWDVYICIVDTKV